MADGQSLLQVQREAVGRNHVEADAREQHDPARFRLCVLRLHRLEHGDLAGDVEIVGAGAQAGSDERLGGVLEWAGAVQHDRDIFERPVDGGGIVEPEGAPLKAGLTGDAVEFSGVPAGDDRLYAQAARCSGDMLADVAGGPVDHKADDIKVPGPPVAPEAARVRGGPSLVQTALSSAPRN